MDALNLYLFQAMAAGFEPHPLLLSCATTISGVSGWACLAVLAWMVGSRPGQFPTVLVTLAVGGVISLFARDLASALDVPRPFMRGLSPLYVPHGLRPGLPSTHASVMFTMAFMVLLRRSASDAGAVLLVVAVLTGWSRIYLGIHFPADIAAGIVLAALTAAVWAVVARPWRDGLARTSRSATH